MINRYKAFLFLLLITSCSYKLKPGKYKFGDISEFVIKENNYYEYKSLNKVKAEFSRGAYKIDKNIVSFYPDSEYIFKVSPIKAYYDSLLPNKIKIIIQNDSIIKLENYKLYFFDGVGDTIFFEKDCSKIFEVDKFSRTQIAITAELSEEKKVIRPRPYNDAIGTNVLFFNDIYEKFGKWNVVYLKLNLKPRMFSFVVLPEYLFQKNRIIKKGWPVYQLVTK